MIKLWYAEHDIDAVVTQHLLPLFEKYHIFTLTGFLGAGKTTLVKRLLAHSGVNQEVTSPTFTYVTRYSN